MGTNHLGHFLLTNLLLDLLKSSAPSRIVVVSSAAHKFCEINRADFMNEFDYNKIRVYGQSKLANILFSKELARQLQGTGVTVNSCHPGLVHTNLGRHMNNRSMNFIKPLYRKLLSPFYKTAFEGAQTQIMLAVDPKLEKVSGKYFADCEEKTPSDAAQSDETARWLWAKSVGIINNRYEH
jgi:NAD(P)-dependent dehydrogenase (short-subunit alcohol dehydrogenase family)